MQQSDLKPYWQYGDIRFFQGEVREVLARLPSKSVQCVITSPPYYGLINYQTGKWEGGNLSCKHHYAKVITRYNYTFENSPEQKKSKLTEEVNSRQYRRFCPDCGAKHIDLQIGFEPDADCKTYGQAQCGSCYVCTMVDVGRSVRHLLRDDGTFFLNLGDSYKEGNLLGVPWRVALALQADGWLLRSDMPWVKRSTMPDSTPNRPAKALEYVFMFTKSMDYYFDMEAIKPKLAASASSLDNEGIEEDTLRRNFRNTDLWFQSISPPHGVVGEGEELVGLDVTSEAYSGHHFATFGTRLVRPLLLAGTSDKGACMKCGSPWKRITEKQPLTRHRPNDYVKRNGQDGTGNSCSNSMAGVVVKTLGWKPTCACEVQEVVPCTVADVFLGSGTTAQVCIETGRSCVGIELSEKYLSENAIPRVLPFLTQAVLF